MAADMDHAQAEEEKRNQERLDKIKAVGFEDPEKIFSALCDLATRLPVSLDRLVDATVSAKRLADAESHAPMPADTEDFSAWKKILMLPQVPKTNPFHREYHDIHLKAPPQIELSRFGCTPTGRNQGRRAQRAASKPWRR